MNQTMDTATLPSLLYALESLAKRNKFHQRVMLGMVTILGLSGLILLSVGSFVEGTDRVVMLVGGALFGVMAFLPYNQSQNLRKQNLVIRMIVVISNRLQGEVRAETLNELMRKLMQYSLRR